MTRLVLRSNTALFGALGVLLLAASWETLFAAVDLPSPQPALWTQLAGGLLLALAYLLWIAPRDVRLTQAVALAAALANAVAVVVISAWLAFGEFEVGALGTTLLVATAGASAAYAAADGWIASRSVAMLLPPD